MKKAVLLHPLSERKRGRREGKPEAKFFESLRPAQDRRRCEAASGRGTLTKEHQRGH